MAYAVSSLLDTLEQLLHSSDLLLPYQREQLESLQKKFTFFEGFLLQSPAEFNGDDFLRRMRRIIRCLARRAEDYISGILISRSIEAGELEERNQILDIHQKAQDMFEEIEFFEAEVLRFCGEADGAIQLPEENCSAEDLSLQALNSVHALDESFLAILDRVTGVPSKLQFLAIVGMRSMGKTVLAERIFNDPFVMHHFYIRAWMTVSEGCHVREILLGLLKCIGCLPDGIYEKSDGQLSEKLYQRLRGQRYLIVLDNLCNTKLWDVVKRWFPDDKNGSRVLLTSRLMNLGIQVYENRSSYHEHFPSAGERWKHFQGILFSEDYNPLELVKIGEQIAQEDQGLLLAIVLTAAVLAKISDTPNYWRDFMQKAGSVMSESVKDVFILDFNQLPLYLRTCFSYIEFLPDDCEIFLYIITRVWNSLGLLRPERLNRLEEVATVHFKDLVESSLNMNKIRWSDCRVKRNFIPDLLWDLNGRKAQKEKFLDLITKSLKFVSVFIDDCRFSISSEIHLCVWLRPIVPLTRSFQCFGLEEWFQPNKWSNIRGASEESRVPITNEEFNLASDTVLDKLAERVKRLTHLAHKLRMSGKLRKQRHALLAAERFIQKFCIDEASKR